MTGEPIGAGSVVGEAGAGRGAAGGAGDPAGGPRAGAGEVQPGDRATVAAEAAGGAERTELVEGDVEVHGVGVGPAAGPLHVVGRAGCNADDRGPEARGPVLDRLQAALDELVPAGRP